MHFREILDGVHEVTTDLGIDLWQQSLSEIEQCQDRVSDHFYTKPDSGTMEIRANGAACSAIIKYFQSDEWYSEVAKLCTNDDVWSSHWAVPTVSWFRRHTRFYYMWHLAPADYVNHEWHVDALRTVVHGLMYLNDHNDATATTLFRHDSNEIAVTTGFDRGWILLQNGTQEHRGINHNDRPRYTFKWALSLKI